jgi:fido (protein-threonine AMPylation protein)
MEAIFDLLEGKHQPAVRIVLGHWLFGYIHPYPDGNGRMARVLMNAMRASGGDPWTVIRVEDRAAYMMALESASVEMDIGPFAPAQNCEPGRPLEPIASGAAFHDDAQVWALCGASCAMKE